MQILVDGMMPATPAAGSDPGAPRAVVVIIPLLLVAGVAAIVVYLRARRRHRAGAKRVARTDQLADMLTDESISSKPAKAEQVAGGTSAGCRLVSSGEGRRSGSVHGSESEGVTSGMRGSLQVRPDNL